MTLITVAAQDVVDYYGDKVPAFARAYANKQFTTNTGVIVESGSPSRPDFYQQFTASLVGTSIRIASGDIHSTTDASDKTDASYTIAIYDANGEMITIIYNKLQVFSENNPTTWSALAIASGAESVPNAPTYLDTKAILALFDSVTNGGVKANSVLHGIVRLDVDPLDLADPIAIGANSPAIMGKQDTLVSGVNIRTVNGLSLLGAGDLPILGGTRLSAYTDFADAVADIGATPTILDIDVNSNVAVPTAIPATLFLRHAGGILTKTGTGAITFAGLGLSDPESKTALFSGFAAGNITFTGTPPHRLSASLWADSDTSLKIKNADYAVKDNAGQVTTVVAHPGTCSTSDIFIHEGVSLHLTAGNYLSTIGTVATGHRALFILQSNVRVYGDGRSRTFVHESSNNNSQIFCASSLHLYPYDGFNENIEICDLSIMGNNGTNIDSSSSAINLGNAQQGIVTRCGFFNVKNFAAYVGGFSTSGNVAKGVWITDNYVDGSHTQVFGTVGGNDVHINRNVIINPQKPVFSVVDAVLTSGSGVVTSATGGFTPAMVGQQFSAHKFGQVGQDFTISGLTSSNQVTVTPVSAWSDTAVSFQWKSAFAAIIDIEPNASTEGSDRIEISHNIIDGGLAITGFNGITIQKGFSAHSRHIDVSHNIIMGYDGSTNYFENTDVNVGADTITIYNHGLRTGQQVLIQSDFSGLGSSAYEHVIRVDQDTIKLGHSLPFAEAGISIDLSITSAGPYRITPVGNMASGIQVFATEYGRVDGNYIIGPGQHAIDIQQTYRLTVQNNTIHNGGISAFGALDSLFSNNNISENPDLGLGAAGAITETDVTFNVDTTAGSAEVTINPFGGGAAGWWYVGKTVLLAGSEYTILRRRAANKFVLSSNVPSTLVSEPLTVYSVNTFTGNRVKRISLAGTNRSTVLNSADYVVGNSLPIAVSGTVNDLQPTTMAARFDLTGSATPVVTGFTVATPPLTSPILDGMQFKFFNAGATAIVLKNEDAGSTAAYRFHSSTGADITLNQYQMAEIEYNKTLNRWMLYKKN